MIRNKCIISNKYFFTVDGKSRINDETTLAYYMSLTVEGQGMLQPAAAGVPAANQEKPAGSEKKDHPAAAPAGVPASAAAAAAQAAAPVPPQVAAQAAAAAAGHPPPAPAKPPAQAPAQPPAQAPAQAPVQAPAGKEKPAPGVLTLNIKISDGSPAAQDVRALPTTNDGMNKLLESISKGSLQLEKLPTFSDKTLTAVTSNYATSPGSGNHPEPSELTEQQWHKVLMNTRALHGYWFDYNLNVLVKARKRAFRLRGAAPVGKPPANEANDSPKTYLPPIPPFYINDDATVNVTEIRNQFQHTLTKQGFNSIAVGGSIGGGAKTLPISVSQAFDMEHSWANQKQDQSSVDSLAVTYNFPRVVVELDPECLELTDECREDAMNVTSREAKDRFFRTYGRVFVTRFTLGGFLHSTRNVTSLERSSLDQVKDKTRIAAGISIQSPKVSGGLNIAKVDSKEESDGSASLLQNVHLTWDAHGGDTLLCSNPPVWAGTVKNYNLWRLMNQQGLVSLEHLIKDVDVVAYRQLDDPTSTSHSGQNPIKDPLFNEHVRTLLVEALMDEQSNAMAQKIKSYYQKGKFDTAAGIKVYNQFMQDNFPGENDAFIKPGTLYGGTNMDQRVGFGLYMANLGELRFD